MDHEIKTLLLNDNIIIGYCLDILHYDKSNLTLWLKTLNKKIQIEVLDYIMEIVIEYNDKNIITLLDLFTLLKKQNVLTKITIDKIKKLNENHLIKDYISLKFNNKHTYNLIKLLLKSREINLYNCDIYEENQTKHDFLQKNKLDGSLFFQINNFTSIDGDKFQCYSKDIINVKREIHNHLFKYIELIKITFDIETTSYKSGCFPSGKNNKDYITIISYTKERELYYHPRINPPIHNILYIYPVEVHTNQDLTNNQIDNIKHYLDEKTMLTNFIKIIKNSDIVIGYNTNNFDWVYLNDRFKKYKLSLFPMLIQTISTKSIFSNENTESIKKISGLINYDLYKALTARDAPKLLNNSLDYVSLKYLSFKKHKLKEIKFNNNILYIPINDKPELYKGLEVVISCQVFEDVMIQYETKFKIIDIKYYSDYIIVALKIIDLNENENINDFIKSLNNDSMISIVKNEASHTDLHEVSNFAFFEKDKKFAYKLINLYSDDLILLFPNILYDTDQYLEGFDTFNNISDKDIKYNTENFLFQSKLNPNLSLINNFIVLSKYHEKYSNIKFNNNDLIRIGDKEKFITYIIYCMNDTRITSMIVNKNKNIISLIEKGHIRKTLLDDSCNKGNSFLNQFATSVYMLERNYVIKTKTHVSSSTIKDKYEGATVLDVKKGFYDIITVLDFASLYPSLMISFNICITTIFREEDVNYAIENGITIFNDNKFINKNVSINDFYKIDVGKDLGIIYYIKQEIKKGIIPLICEDFINKRKEVRKVLSATTDEFEKYRLDIEQANIKIANNSTYGSLGDSNSVHFNKYIAASITALGRKYLKETQDFIENHKKYKGYFIRYQDTDSEFIHTSLNKSLKQQYSEIREILNDINKKLPGSMKLELEKVYSPVLLIKKKSRIGVKFEPEYKKICDCDDEFCNCDCNITLGKGKREQKGTTQVKRDIPLIIKNLEKELVNIILNDENNNNDNNKNDKKSFFLKIYNFISNYLENITKKDYKHFLLTKTLKNESDYKQNSRCAHINLAKKLKELKFINSIKSGDKIRYLYIDEYKDKHYQYEQILPAELMIKNNLHINYNKYQEMIFKLIENIFGSLFNNDELLKFMKLCNINIKLKKRDIDDENDENDENDNKELIIDV